MTLFGSFARWLQGVPARRGLSLRSRFVLATMVGELAFASALAIAVGLFTVRQEFSFRQNLLRQTTAAIAASVMPMVADQEAERVQAQLDSILARLGESPLECLIVFDGAGQPIARSSCAEAQVCGQSAQIGNRGVIDFFTRPQVMVDPITVDGLTLATVHAYFKPIGLTTALREPVILMLFVVSAVSLVSVPWTAWLFTASVAEPLDRLKDKAQRLAAGDTSIALHDGRQDEIGSVQVAFDEMSRKLTERQAALEDAYRQLQDAFAIEARAKQELETLMQMKSNFVAVASHELRAPLAIIRLYVDLLFDQDAHLSEDERRNALSAMSAASSRLTTIVSDLMDAALLERGLMALNPTVVPLGRIISEAVEDANALYASGPTSVIIEGELPDFVVEADALRIRQVLDNLISNAVKYSEGAPDVVVRARVEDRVGIVEVIDFGRGIPPEKMSCLFQLFGRAEDADSGMPGGLGLGLAISERIVRAHGGTLEYKPNPGGRGSVFTMRLPSGGAARRHCVEVSSEVHA